MALASGFGKDLLFTFFVSILIAFSAGADKDFSGGGVRVKVRGQSGKITLKQGSKSELTCEVDSIGEVDASGGDVGRSGNAKHGVNSLASQMFSFSSVNKNAYYQGIKAVNVNQSSYLDGPGAKMEIMIYLFLEDGNVTFGNESFAVFSGNLKFNIQIMNWTFCSAEDANCKKGNKDEVGAFIDLSLACKDKSNKKPIERSMADREKSQKRKFCYMRPGRKCPKIYDMGGNSEMLLSTTIKRDGNFSSMPGSYPQVVTKGSKNLFKFRIPKFSDMVLIDPVSTIDGDGDGDGDGDKDGASTLPFNFLAFTLLLNVAAMFAM